MKAFLFFSTMRKNSMTSHMSDGFFTGTAYFLEHDFGLKKKHLNLKLLSVISNQMMPNYSLPGKGFVSFDVSVQCLFDENGIAEIIVVFPDFSVSRK